MLQTPRLHLHCHPTGQLPTSGWVRYSRPLLSAGPQSPPQAPEHGPWGRQLGPGAWERSSSPSTWRAASRYVWAAPPIGGRTLESMSIELGLLSCAQLLTASRSPSRSCPASRPTSTRVLPTASELTIPKKSELPVRLPLLAC
jgi:hypothetical protein